MSVKRWCRWWSSSWTVHWIWWGDFHLRRLRRTWLNLLTWFVSDPWPSAIAASCLTRLLSVKPNISQMFAAAVDGWLKEFGSVLEHFRLTPTLNPISSYMPIWYTGSTRWEMKKKVMTMPGSKVKLKVRSQWKSEIRPFWTIFKLSPPHL